MNALAGSPYRRAAAMLLAWQRNARGVLQWAHPSWLASALAIDETQAAGLTQAVAAAHADDCSLALLRHLGLPMPSLEAFAEPGPLRLDALPAAAGLRVLRIRALRFRRAEIRRIVDKRTRATVVQWAGLPLDRLTGDAPNDRRAMPDIAQMAARVPIPPVAMLDDHALALEGYALIRRDLEVDLDLGGARSPCPLLRLALPRGVAADRPVDGYASVPSSMQTRDNAAHASHQSHAARHWVDQIPADVDQHGTAALFAELPNLLPEYPWLSG
nr:hypothetical protein HUO10_004798 [Paraburkholderia busanensis]